MVAVESYFALPPVPGAARTGNDWESFLRGSLGVDRVRVLANADATREEILTFAHRASDDVGKGADLWFVFVGHGAPSADGKDGALVGADAQQTVQSLAARSLAQRKLLETLGRGKQGRTIVVIDACFSGRTGTGAALARGAQPVVAVQDLPPLGKRAVVLSAAKSNEFAGALPGEARPGFSYLLLGALRGWGDENGDGSVTAQEATRWVRARMRAISGRTQTPQSAGEVTLALARGVSEPDPGVDELIAAAGRAPQPVAPPPVEDRGECVGGQERTADTAGHCCWPGQAWNGAECVGAPTACPEGAQVDRAAQACIFPDCGSGTVRASDGIHCCWPRQAWSTSRGMCIGTPSCPRGTVAADDSCAPDSDEDGKSDVDDRCPDQPEDFDGVSDEDGCPEDNDGDGVADADDKCPDAAEDDDGFETDGCPDPDNDHDGIADTADACPDDAEDLDGLGDDDGCPEDDVDLDGVADTADSCPLRREDRDGIDDEDGCPEAADGRLWPSYAVAGAGVALLGGSAALFIGTGGDRGAARSAAEAGEITQAELFERQEELNERATSAAIIAGTGLAVLGCGALWWFLDADNPLKGRADVRLHPHGGSIAWTWGWP